ncbi:MAG: hypothetical protein ACRYFX_07315 [Janthinobacterium lividum]
MQTTINQRLKFLLDHFKISARTLSRDLGVADTNTQNYIGSRQAEPGADYLEKLVLHYAEIDAYWLLTGDGKPFLEIQDATTDTMQDNRGNHNVNIGTNHGTASYKLSDCEKDNASLRQENKLLHNQLVDKERIIRLYESQRPAA